MANRYYIIKTTMKDCKKKYVKDIKIFLKKKKTKGKKRLKRDIKTLLKKKKKKSISIIMNTSKIYLTIEEIVI